ncbi:MAG: CTP synthase [Elusimicrobia bacterium]|nr:CTP synthase [Elusimicrobiota bacterium]
MAKYIFVTGGVVSSLGKGISAASLGRLLEARTLKVTMLKCDPYINVDPGTMNPYQHGEVYVTVDGAETDLDLGHYERFLDVDMHRINNITAGQIYESVIAKERQGEFLGATIQVIPHITDEIKNRFKTVAKGFDVVVIEIGGTVGDIESLPFLEAARQMKLDAGRDEVLYLHVTLIPYLKSSDELKTKPTQHSVNKLREIGIDPDIIICRTEKPLGTELKSKIALFCSVPREAVIEAPDVAHIYEVPLLFEKQGLDEQILMLLRMRSQRKNLEEWQKMVEQLKTAKEDISIAIAGKYTKLKDAYKSIEEALAHAGLANGIKVRMKYVDVESQGIEELDTVHGILVPGGFGDRGIEGKIKAIQYAREKKVPFLGLCLGMQLATVEIARNVLGLKEANSTEFNPDTKHPIIDLLPEQKKIKEKGATMRLGSFPCHLKKESLAYKAYNQSSIHERHRHRYELNSKYRDALEDAGFLVTGEYTEKGLAEIMEFIHHPWHLSVQFHPEFQSRPNRPHPLFKSFVAAAIRHMRSLLEPKPDRQEREKPPRQTHSRLKTEHTTIKLGASQLSLNIPAITEGQA